MAEESTQKGWTPVPDPTVLTTQALLREITALKEILTTRLEANDRALGLFRESVANELLLVRTVIETRLDANDKAIRILQDIADRFPDRIDEKIGALKQIHEGAFDSIQVQFRERDTRTEQQSKQSEVAINAALQAAKEAVAEQNRSSSTAINKSEVATDKRIDQIVALVSTITSASDDKFSDIKERLTRLEGIGLGQLGAKAESVTSTGHQTNLAGIVVAAISALIAVAALILGLRA